MAFSPGGRLLASASDDQTVRLWDTTTGTETSRLTGHTGGVQAVAFSPNGHVLASASNDGTIRVSSPNGELLAWLPPVWSNDVPRRSQTAGEAQRRGDVQQVHDQAAVEDLLGRSALAGGLAGQLVALHAADPAKSFGVHISGTWGSGKSSLVNLMVKGLNEQARANDWIVPEQNRFFDAWRESQIGPAWWSLLTWLRTTVRNNQGDADRRVRRWLARRRFDLVEFARRLQLAGLLLPSAVVSTLGVALSLPLTLYLLRRADPDKQLGALGNLIEIIGGAAGVAGTVIAVGLATGRLLTWKTPAGARVFERRDDNPMESVVAHSRWLRSQVAGPLLLVLDDVDRCRADFVVELLEAVQTLLRADGGKKAKPLLVVVCADERWLHVAFEQAYAPFAGELGTPGRPLGHLFLAKLFQLHLRVPALTSTASADFGRAKLGVRQASSAGTAVSPQSTSTLAADVRPVVEIERAITLDKKIEVLDRVVIDADRPEDAVAIRRAAFAVGRTSMSEAVQRELQHELEDFLPLVEATPRAIVRFLNAYAIQRLATTSGTSGERPTPGALARWTVISQRWPSLALRLIDAPELLNRWHANGPADNDDHLPVLRSPEFHQVVIDESRSPAFTTADLRLCLGLPRLPPSST